MNLSTYVWACCLECPVRLFSAVRGAGAVIRYPAGAATFIPQQTAGRIRSARGVVAVKVSSRCSARFKAVCVLSCAAESF